MIAIRGASFVKENNKESIIESVNQMISELFSINNIDEEQITCILFSQTPDLTALNAATALRLNGFCQTTPLMCFSEAIVDNMAKLCIRVLVLTNQEITEVKHVYTNGAQALRPDFAQLKK